MKKSQYFTKLLRIYYQIILYYILNIIYDIYYILYIKLYIYYQTIDDRDPPWINKTVKTLIEKKSKAYQLYKQNKQNIALFEKFQSLLIQLNDLIEHRKQSYYSRLVDKLRDKKTSPKAYWPLLKTFLNNKKIPCIPPLFHDNDFVTDFQKKSRNI